MPPMPGRLRAADAARAEVVQLERQLAHRIVGGAGQVLEDPALDVPGERRDRERVPQAHQLRLEPADDPRHALVGRLDRHQRVADRHDRALRHGTDPDRQASVEVTRDVPPPFFGEGHAVRREERGRFRHVGVPSPDATGTPRAGTGARRTRSRRRGRPRLSKYPSRRVVPGGYCRKCDALYESVRRMMLSLGEDMVLSSSFKSRNRILCAAGPRSGGCRTGRGGRRGGVRRAPHRPGPEAPSPGMRFRKFRLSSARPRIAS